MAAAPEPWRARYERERLVGARDLRAEVEKYYRPDGEGAAPNRMLNALIAPIEGTRPRPSQADATPQDPRARVVR